MSIHSVRLFYEKLGTDASLRAKAMELQNYYSDQEKLIEAFLRLAQKNGFDFFTQELAAYIHENGTAENA